jgi:hypothetical protein
MLQNGKNIASGWDSVNTPYLLFECQIRLQASSKRNVQPIFQKKFLISFGYFFFNRGNTA